MSSIDSQFNSARKSQASIQIIRTGPTGHIVGFMDGYLRRENLDHDFDVGHNLIDNFLAKRLL